MAHGAGKPGQPAGGQRPMFGGGSPVFAQMPAYTPVTRGPDAAPPPPPQPQQPAFNPYAAPQQQPSHPGSGLSYPNPQTPSPLAYPGVSPAAPNYPSAQPAPNYQTAAPQQPHYQQAAPQPHYQPGAPSSQPSYQPAAPQQPSYQPAPSAGQSHYLDIQGFQSAPARQPADFAPQSYRPAGQPAQDFAAEHASPQNYPAANFAEPQAFTGQGYQDQSFGDASFPEPGANDASFPESGFDQNFTEPAFGNQNFAKNNFGDASFPEPQNFDAGYPAAPSYGHQSQHAPADQSFETFGEDASQDYGMGSGDVPQSDPRRQLQAFDALYDQPPQIALGSTEPRRAAQDFYESERLDADFLDEGQALPPPAARSKFAIGGRSVFMVGSALLGAIALGGALAFAYKQSGGGLSNGEPPLVTADNRPVKEMPEQPGGKEFPHKNKLIYDRLTNGEEPEAERLVPRQENVAVPAMPPSMETAGMPQPVASTDLGAPPTTQAVGGDQMAVASVNDGTMPDGGPRRVKTMVVRPDGSMAEQEPAAAVPEMPGEQPQMLAAATPPAPPQAATPPAPPQAAPQVAAAPPPPPAPAPAPAPAPQQTAAAAQAAAPAAAPSKFVVQVGAHKSQAEALAIYADIQQKNPSLLGGYSPMLQKASVSGGTMYRLRVGPMENKGAADKLCQQLKAQGTDCFVAAQ